MVLATWHWKLFSQLSEVPNRGGGGELVRYNLGRAVLLRKWTHFYTKLNQTFDPLLYQKSHFSAKLIIILKTFSKIPVIFEKLDSKFMTFWPVSWQLKFEKTLKSDPIFKNKNRGTQRKARDIVIHNNICSSELARMCGMSYIS